MNEKLKRTFLCFPVPMEVRSKKNMLYSTIEGSPAEINWVKNDNLHLTLKFIGYTTDSQISKIINTLKNLSKEITVIITTHRIENLPENAAIYYLNPK